MHTQKMASKLLTFRQICNVNIRLYELNTYTLHAIFCYQVSKICMQGLRIKIEGFFKGTFVFLVRKLFLKTKPDSHLPTAIYKALRLSCQRPFYVFVQCFDPTLKLLQLNYVFISLIFINHDTLLAFFKLLDFFIYCTSNQNILKIQLLNGEIFSQQAS